MTRLFVAILTAIGLAGPAAALPPLKENATVVNGLYALGVADLVQEKCDSISPRMVKAYLFLQSLRNHALDAGYSDEEIKALVENRAEKEALRKRIRSDLRARGASGKTPEGYCTVGREEIAKDTMAGRLLRTN